MLTFVIPIKSKSVASDWTHVCELFERTLKSIGNQTDSNFKVVAVCHEIPSSRFTPKNLHFLQVDFPPPSPESSGQELLMQKRIDKGNKIKIGVAFAHEKFNTDYVMLVDSDDFVSNRIAAFVNQNTEDSPGWFIGKGYLSLKWNTVLIVTNKFNYLCGSSVIFKPEMLDHFFDKEKMDLYFDHRLTTLDANIPLKKVPFYAGIYNMRNGENIYMSVENIKEFSSLGNWATKDSFKRIINRIKNYRFKIITPKLRKEFQFYPYLGKE